MYRGYFPVQPGHLSCKEGFEAGHPKQVRQKELLTAVVYFRQLAATKKSDDSIGG